MHFLQLLTKNGLKRENLVANQNRQLQIAVVFHLKVNNTDEEHWKVANNRPRGKKKQR